MGCSYEGEVEAIKIATEYARAVFSISKLLQVLQKAHNKIDPCYLHLPIFSYIHSPLVEECKVVVITVFLSKLGHRPLLNDTYYETILVKD